MEWIRKSRFVIIPFLLAAFIIFTQQLIGNSFEREFQVKGDAIKWIPVSICSEDVFGPVPEYLHFQLLPVIKEYSDRSSSLDLFLLSCLDKDKAQVFSLEPLSSDGFSILQYICKFQI
ncbi:MAG: hypothetical protein Q8867_05065 [Bacteroidota bacterium]|nr:hypothetical protein [Bacteroidota bacterium]